MPILANAKKALRVSKKKTEFNSRVKSILKTMVDKMKKSPSAENLRSAYSAVDKAVRKHLMHKNKAARVKSQLSKLSKPGTKVVATPVKTAVAKKAPAKKVVTKAPVKVKAAPKKAAAKNS